MKKLFLFILRVYHRYFSIGGCRFIPTCSQYSYQAIERYGIIYGSWLTVKRISRCHPWSQGGFDPVN